MHAIVSVSVLQGKGEKPSPAPGGSRDLGAVAPSDLTFHDLPFQALFSLQMASFISFASLPPQVSSPRIHLSAVRSSPHPMPPLAKTQSFSTVTLLKSCPPLRNLFVYLVNHWALFCLQREGIVISMSLLPCWTANTSTSLRTTFYFYLQSLFCMNE